MSISPFLTPNRKWNLLQAAADFFFLQNRSFPRAAALDLTGNKYNLNAFERMLLHRGLFSQQEALARRAKRVMGDSWQQTLLAIDGHNVQITIESYIDGRPLLKANDGAMRDLAGQSSLFRYSERSNLAIDMLFRFFEEFRPRKVLFLFDQPMSHSGELASVYRTRLKKARIAGDAHAVPVPENEIPYDACFAASSDGAVIQASQGWLDLASRVVEYFGVPRITADFSPIVLTRSAAQHLFADGGPFW